MEGQSDKTIAQQRHGAPLLDIRDLRTHIFTRRGVVKAVDGVSMQVWPGETLGLVGESGSGKTMTCLSILKLLPRGARIVAGQVLLQGHDLVPEPEDAMEHVRGKQIGMVLQNSLAALDPVFTIGTQVGEPLVVHDKLSWKAALRRVVELLRLVRVVAPEIRVRNYPHELSGGMRQRVSSAAAIGCVPSLLIADEPTTALDVTTQRQYLDLLKELQQQTGMAILFVTHDISLVGNMCDQIAVFYGGTVVEYGPREQVLNQPSHPYTMALLQSIPQLGEYRERLQSIAGDPPDLARLPTGCAFHPRCHAALEICHDDEPPPVFTLADARRVRCWLREDEHVGSSAGSLRVDETLSG